MRALLAIALLGIAALGARPARADDGSLARVRAAGALAWGADTQGGEPYVYPDPLDPSKTVGFEVELAAAIARELGVRAELVQNDWAHLVPSLERGAFDVILNGLEVTASRVGRVRFSRPYYAFAERLVVRRAAPAPPRADLAALAGRRVGTLANSLAWEMLGRAGAEAVAYEGVEEPYLDLVQGRTEAVLLDDVIASRYGEPKAELVAAGDVGEGYYALATRPADEALARAIDEALGRVAARGELRAILARSRLWGPREERLLAWTDVDQRAMLAGARGGGEAVDGAPPTATRLGVGHLTLFLRGAAVTLALSTLAMALAVPLGMGLALLRLYGPRAGRALAAIYVEVYRGTPVLLQLYVLYYGLAPVLRVNAFAAAVLGLGMNYAAYEAEVYRAGILAVPRGQLEAAWALGMTTPLALRRVVLPQAARIALPAVTNDFIALLKDSSLVSVITVVELTKQMTITAVELRSWLAPGALCALLYFAMSYPLARRARALEARLARG